MLAEPDSRNCPRRGDDRARRSPFAPPRTIASRFEHRSRFSVAARHVVGRRLRRCGTVYPLLRRSTQIGARSGVPIWSSFYDWEGLRSVVLSHAVVFGFWLLGSRRKAPIRFANVSLRGARMPSMGRAPRREAWGVHSARAPRNVARWLAVYGGRRRGGVNRQGGKSQYSGTYAPSGVGRVERERTW